MKSSSVGRAALPAVLAALALLGSLPGRAGSQSVLDAPANLSHGWMGAPGVIQFQLLHRFSLGPAPTRKLINSPTLSFSTGLRPWATLGFNYASNSDLVPAFPNEWEFFARVAALRQESGAPIDLIIQAAHNVAAASQDGSVVLARRVGRWRLLAHGMAFSRAFYSNGTRIAAGAGAVFRLVPNVALSADATTLVDRSASERVAWSAGLDVGVPSTPHTLSLHATNVGARTLEGIARGGPTTRYGFEYTIPLTMRRYRRPASEGSGTRAAPGSDTVVVEVKQLTFGSTLEIEVGTTVVWRNMDPLPHAVIADSGAFTSGLIDPAGSFRFTFRAAGTFSYHCAPHPFMKGTVVVR